MQRSRLNESHMFGSATLKKDDLLYPPEEARDVPRSAMIYKVDATVRLIG